VLTSARRLQRTRRDRVSFWRKADGTVVGDDRIYSVAINGLRLEQANVFLLHISINLRMTLILSPGRLGFSAQA
jgi:hypothetical protein